MVSVQWQNQSFQFHSNDDVVEDLTIETFVKDMPDIVGGEFMCHLLWTAGRCIQHLTHFMQSNSYSGVARCGHQLGILKVIDETSLFLQLVDQRTSLLILALTDKIVQAPVQESMIFNR